MKWWEEERKVFCGRADSFIALMHLVQGRTRTAVRRRRRSSTVCLLLDLEQQLDGHRSGSRTRAPRSSIRYTMVPASLYLGFSASIKWVAEGTYLTSTARSLAHDLNLEEGNVIGNFNGEFWGMFAGHQFVGNLMSLFLLKDGTGVTTSGSGTTLLYIVFVCSRTLGTILMCFLQKRDAKGEETLPDSSVSFYSSIV
ncbi:hypothetical protein CsSME_00045143 [Camellia sinensis var. sinensis]